jgi:hypothetical protein
VAEANLEQSRSSTGAALRFPQIEFHAPTILERMRNAIAASRAARDYSALIQGAVKAARKDRLRPRRRAAR